MSQGSLLPNAADFRPDVKSLGPGSSVLRGSDMIAAEVEQVISHTVEMMLAALSVIWGGIVDRHPRLRIAFLESGGGWISPWLDRMDRHFDDRGFNETAPKTRPSELFLRNCWISFEPVENSIAVLADYIGPHKIMWATDYPHRDSFFPGAPQMLRDRLGPLSPAAKHQVLAGGAMGFYALQ
jgi:predicted TIM-barrel fold metal-dependent hydrolase